MAKCVNFCDIKITALQNSSLYVNLVWDLTLFFFNALNLELCLHPMYPCQEQLPVYICYVIGLCIPY